MKTIKYLLFLSALISFQTIKAQDTIVLNTGEAIEALVLTKSDKEIKYKFSAFSDSPIIILKPNKVEKIIFRNGTEMTILPDLIRMHKRFGANAGLIFGLGIESVFYKFQADYYISPEFNIELNGLIDAQDGDGGGMAIGTKYYFNAYKPKKLKQYAGLFVGAINNDFVIQIPFGMNYISKRGFEIKGGFNGLYVPSNSDYDIYLELLLGWRF